MARLTERLKEEAGAQWMKIVNHPFTDAIANGSIGKEAMKFYLIQDHRFLDNFVILLASMVANAPSLKDRIPGCQFLGLITGKENTYFERSLEALGVGEKERCETPNSSATNGFMELMLNTARSGKYDEMLCLLVVAEWSYLSWADRVKGGRLSELPFWCNEWIDLHCGEYFESVVSYLRGLLDKAGETMDDESYARCKAAFLRAVDLEVEFFDQAWSLHK